MSAPAVAITMHRRERVLAQPALDGLFLATILLVSYAKIHWSLGADLRRGGRREARSLVSTPP